MLCERLVIHQVVTYLLPSFVLKTACECSSISKRFVNTSSETKLYRMTQFHYLDHLVSTRVSKFDIFIHIAYDSSNPDIIIDLKSRSPLLLRARRLRGSFSIILVPKVSRLFPFFKSLSKFFLKTFICRIPDFRRRRNPDNLITGL